MTLIVEDGSIVANANAYVDVADCASYHASRGNVFASSPDELAEQAIIRATSYIDLYYKGRWGGRKVERTQSLQFPRFGLTDEDGFEVPYDEVPKEIVSATCEAALIELTTPNSLTPAYSGGRLVLSSSVSAGGVSSSKTYSESSERRQTITIIEDYLKSYAESGYNTTVYRA